MTTVDHVSRRWGIIWHYLLSTGSEVMVIGVLLGVADSRLQIFHFIPTRQNSSVQGDFQIVSKANQHLWLHIREATERKRVR